MEEVQFDRFGRIRYSLQSSFRMKKWRTMLLTRSASEDPDLSKFLNDIRDEPKNYGGLFLWDTKIWLCFLFVDCEWNVTLSFLTNSKC